MSKKNSKYKPFIQEVKEAIKKHDLSLRNVTFEMASHLTQEEIYWLITSLVDLIEDSEKVMKLFYYLENEKELLEEM
jgi:hypothetical protein